MKRLFTPRKTFLMLAFIISVQTFAAFVGHSNGDGDKKISLKNFSKYGHKASAYPSLSLSKFQFSGSENLYQVNSLNSIQGQSIIRFQSGNTTYVYPYKYKVKISLFKTPTAPTAH